MPIVEVGPCPEYIFKRSGRGISLFLSERAIASVDDAGKSVLPMEPANSVSPVKITSSSSLSRHMLPGLCPGV